MNIYGDRGNILTLTRRAAWRGIDVSVEVVGRGPVADALGPLSTILEGYVLASLSLWFRGSWPRIREDPLQRLAWLILVPVALAQLAITAVGVVLTSR